jgi:short-subunit dehydrogenase
VPGGNTAHLVKTGAGGIGIVGSVAGYSGLPKALAYGPSKAAIINLCESLYVDLHPKNIGVYMINPGFVATPMTANNDFDMPALMTAPAAAQALVRGLEQGEFHIHFPKRFTNWLRLARLLPYRGYFYLVHKVTGL